MKTSVLHASGYSTLRQILKAPFWSNITANSFVLRPVTYSEVFKLLTTMRAECSTGCDQIPIKYLKLSADIIFSPLTHILNCFINTKAPFLPLRKQLVFHQFRKLTFQRNPITTDPLPFYQFSPKFMKDWS